MEIHTKIEFGSEKLLEEAESEFGFHRLQLSKALPLLTRVSLSFILLRLD
jgi:hypothetical protein